MHAVLPAADAEARFSDLHFQPIAAGDLNVSSLDSSLEIVPPSLSTDGTWKGRVAVGATSHCGVMAQVRWVMHGQESSLDGQLPVSIDMARADNISLTLSESKVTRPFDPAAHAPIGLSTHSTVSVHAHFAGAALAPLDITTHPEVTLSVAEASCAYFDGNTLYVRVNATCSTLNVGARSHRSECSGSEATCSAYASCDLPAASFTPSPSPKMFFITLPPTFNCGSPNGHPQIALKCISYCEQLHASMV